MEENSNDYFDVEEAQPEKKKRGCLRFIFLFFIILLIGGGGYGYFKYYFVFGEGVKAGELNYVVYKGYLFKTYEGKMIQSGYSSSESAPGIQSNEFLFSVERKDLADRLMRSGGKEVELHYKEYNGALPWRGYSKYVVDSILVITDAAHSEPLPFE